MEQRDTRQGYTLLELTLVLGMAGLLSGLALTGLGRMSEAQHLQMGVQMLLNALHDARTQAVSRNLAIQIRVSPGRDRFGLGIRTGETRWLRLPSGIRFTRAPRRPLTFHSRGFCSPAGSFQLSGSAGTVRVVVSVSGRIRWERRG